MRKSFKDTLPCSGKIGEAKDSRSERCKQGPSKGALQGPNGRFFERCAAREIKKKNYMKKFV